jgi:hypothetical protein
MQDGCKVYMDSYMESYMASCFMVTWTTFNYHLLDVGLTENWETIALWTLGPLVYSILLCVRTRMNRNSLK